MRILLVDDSQTARALNTGHLRQMGHEVLEAQDGAAALELFRERAPDLVILDVNMPGMDGYEVARAMREQGGRDEWVPIIFLSARIEDADLARGIESGGDDYLAKPVSAIVLRAKVQAMQRITDMRRKLVEMGQELSEANVRLKELSARDGLTGLANRRSFDDALSQDWRRGTRNQSPLAVILCDVDFFKRYNDCYGHQRGDDCLRAVAGVLAGSVHRAGDTVARLGGEEFSILMASTTAWSALQVAQRVLDAVRGLAIEHAQSGVKERIVTVSLGVSVGIPEANHDASHLMEAADRALYQAKAQGRNRAVFLPFTDVHRADGAQPPAANVEPAGKPSTG